MPQRSLAALTQEPTLLAPRPRKPTRSWSSLAPAADVPAAARGTTVRPSRDVVRTACHLASDTPEIILLGGPAVSGHPCRGAGDPGQGHQYPPRADRLLRLPVLRGAAARRRRRVACQLLHSPLTRLGTADAHGVSSPVGACLDWQRHLCVPKTYATWADVLHLAVGSVPRLVRGQVGGAELAEGATILGSWA